MHDILPEYHRVSGQGRVNVDASLSSSLQYIVETQGDTLLPHFYAMYRLTVDDKENYVLVMRNVLSTKLKIHFKYDVKVGAIDLEIALDRRSRAARVPPSIELPLIRRN